MTKTPSQTSYAIEGGDAGHARLELMSRYRAPGTRDLLTRVGIPSGARCLDVGCGCGHVTRMLAELAGPNGHALGIDRDERVIEINAAQTHASGLTNVEFRCQDIADFTDGRFDVVFAGLLMMHLPNAEQVITQLIQALRPHGLFISEDVDLRTAFCEPPSTAFVRAVELQHDVVEQRNGGLRTHTHLPTMLREAGLVDVGLSLLQPVWSEPEFKTIIPLSLSMTAEAMIECGLSDRDEIDAVLAELAELVDDPNRIFVSPRTHQTWGRKP